MVRLPAVTRALEGPGEVRPAGPYGSLPAARLLAAPRIGGIALAIVAADLVVLGVVRFDLMSSSLAPSSWALRT
jgi:hypothetical protein